MLDEPVNFTDDQQRLFRRISAYIRSRVSDFTEAGKWMDAGAGLPDARGRLARVRELWLIEARARRPRGPKRDDEPGRQAGRGYLYLIPHTGATPSVRRSSVARQIRDERSRAASDPTKYDIMQAAVHALLKEPPNYSRLRPDIAQANARRVLLVTWILTDTDHLRTDPAITALQDWEWGEHHWSWLDAAFTNDLGFDLAAVGELNRAYASTSLLDDHLAGWVKLAGDAARMMMETGATKAEGLHGAADSRKPYPVAVAVAMKSKDQSLSIREIAKAVGMHYSTLAKDPLWKAASNRLKQVGKGKMRRGSKSKDGSVEAVDE